MTRVCLVLVLCGLLQGSSAAPQTMKVKPRDPAAGPNVLLPGGAATFPDHGKMMSSMTGPGVKTRSDGNMVKMDTMSMGGTSGGMKAGGTMGAGNQFEPVLFSGTAGESGGIVKSTGAMGSGGFKVETVGMGGASGGMQAGGVMGSGLGGQAGVPHGMMASGGSTGTGGFKVESVNLGGQAGVPRGMMASGGSTGSGGFKVESVNLGGQAGVPHSMMTSGGSTGSGGFNVESVNRGGQAGVPHVMMGAESQSVPVVITGAAGKPDVSGVASSGLNDLLLKSAGQFGTKDVKVSSGGGTMVDTSIVVEGKGGPAIDVGLAGVGAGAVDFAAGAAGVDAGAVDFGTGAAGVGAGAVDFETGVAGVGAGAVDFGTGVAGVGAGAVDFGAGAAGVGAGAVDFGAGAAGVGAGAVDFGAGAAGVGAGAVDFAAGAAGVGAGAAGVGPDVFASGPSGIAGIDVPIAGDLKVDGIGMSLPGAGIGVGAGEFVPIDAGAIAPGGAVPVDKVPSGPGGAVPSDVKPPSPDFGPTGPVMPPYRDPKQDCASLLDLIVCIDGSDSISWGDFDLIRKAMSNLVDAVTVGPNHGRIGFIVYSSTIAKVLPMTGDVSVLKYEVDYMPHPRDGTHTSQAIEAMRQHFRRKGRPDVPHVGFMITDGISKDPAATSRQARLAREAGINLFAVGVGDTLNMTELKSIAPEKGHVITIASFSQLNETLDALVKTVCPCGPPTYVANAVVKGRGRAIGAVRNYVCINGYQMLGDPKIRCRKNSQWTAVNFTCSGCPDPMPTIPYGTLIPTSRPNEVGSSRGYVCNEGFVAPAKITPITCESTPNGPSWTDPPYQCQACGLPMDRPNMKLGKGPSLVGTILKYSCFDGYLETAPLKIRCVPGNGIPYWSDLNETCITCLDPPEDVLHARLDMGVNRVNKKRFYQCIDGYVATGPIFRVCKGNKGQVWWTKPRNKCVTCPPPLETLNNNTVLRQDGVPILVGLEKVYECKNGYVPSGPMTIRCEADLKKGVAYWTSTQNILCVGCPAPPMVNNASPPRFQGDLTIGTVLKYQCNDGYLATGTIEYACSRSINKAVWSTNNNRCITCDDPPPIANAILDKLGDNRIGSFRYYDCISGFVASKKDRIRVQCIAENFLAVWTAASHGCRGCLAPPALPNAIMDMSDGMVNETRIYACAKGYVPRGNKMIKCLKNAEWSPTNFYCADCGDEPLVENAMPEAGLRTTGAQRTYVCAQGYRPSKTPIIRCKKNARWSNVTFYCKTCDDPPVEYRNSVVDAGINLIGTVRKYFCKPGYFHTGSIDRVCQENAVWSTPPDYCRDCGKPYRVFKANITDGPSTIGSIRTYECKQGYVATKKNPTSICQPDGKWSHPGFKCIRTLTATLAPPEPTDREPSICDNTKRLNGVGYLPQPHCCVQFIQCYYDGKGGARAVYRRCDFGLFWDQESLSCKPANDIDCQSDLCRYGVIPYYRVEEWTKCGAYWQCVNGKSVPGNCPRGYRFDPVNKCTPDPTCQDSSAEEDFLPGCKRQPLDDPRWYRELVVRGYWLEIECPAGTRYSTVHCDCTAVVEGYKCSPEVYLPFNHGVSDESAHQVSVLNEGVVVSNGTAWFGGNSRLVIQQLPRNESHGLLVITLRYWEDKSGPTAHELQALVSNGDCAGARSSVLIAKTPGSVLLETRTREVTSLRLPTQEEAWKDVAFYHDGERLVGKVDGAADMQWSVGQLRQTFCGIQIGGSSGLRGFVGEMDDITIYRCLPPDSVLTF